MDILIPLVVISAILLVSIRKFKPQVWKKVVQLSSRNRMSWLKKFIKFITPLSYVEIRTRNKKGRYIADDPTTIENEAYKKVLRKKPLSSKRK
jgi:hypothetical protein